MCNWARDIKNHTELFPVIVRAAVVRDAVAQLLQPLLQLASPLQRGVTINDRDNYQGKLFDFLLALASHEAITPQDLSTVLKEAASSRNVKLLEGLVAMPKYCWPALHLCPLVVAAANGTEECDVQALEQLLLLAADTWDAAQIGSALVAVTERLKCVNTGGKDMLLRKCNCLTSGGANWQLLAATAAAMKFSRWEGVVTLLTRVYGSSRSSKTMNAAGKGGGGDGSNGQLVLALPPGVTAEMVSGALGADLAPSAAAVQAAVAAATAAAAAAEAAAAAAEAAAAAAAAAMASAAAAQPSIDAAAVSRSTNTVAPLSLTAAGAAGAAPPAVAAAAKAAAVPQLPPLMLTVRTTARPPLSPVKPSSQSPQRQGSPLLLCRKQQHQRHAVPPGVLQFPMSPSAIKALQQRLQQQQASVRASAPNSPMSPAGQMLQQQQQQRCNVSGTSLMSPGAHEMPVQHLLQQHQQQHASSSDDFTSPTRPPVSTMPLLPPLPPLPQQQQDIGPADMSPLSPPAHKMPPQEQQHAATTGEFESPMCLPVSLMPPPQQEQKQQQQHSVRPGMSPPVDNTLQQQQKQQQAALPGEFESHIWPSVGTVPPQQQQQQSATQQQQPELGVPADVLKPVMSPSADSMAQHQQQQQGSGRRPGQPAAVGSGGVMVPAGQLDSHPRGSDVAGSAAAALHPLAATAPVDDSDLQDAAEVLASLHSSGLTRDGGPGVAPAAGAASPCVPALIGPAASPGVEFGANYLHNHPMLEANHILSAVAPYPASGSQGVRCLSLADYEGGSSRAALHHQQGQANGTADRSAAIQAEQAVQHQQDQHQQQQPEGRIPLDHVEQEAVLHFLLWRQAINLGAAGGAATAARMAVTGEQPQLVPRYSQPVATGEDTKLPGRSAAPAMFGTATMAGLAGIPAAAPHSAAAATTHNKADGMDLLQAVDDEVADAQTEHAQRRLHQGKANGSVARTGSPVTAQHQQLLKADTKQQAHEDITLPAAAAAAAALASKGHVEMNRTGVGAAAAAAAAAMAATVNAELQQPVHQAGQDSKPDCAVTAEAAIVSGAPMAVDQQQLQQLQADVQVMHGVKQPASRMDVEEKSGTAGKGAKRQRTEGTTIKTE